MDLNKSQPGATATFFLCTSVALPTAGSCSGVCTPCSVSFCISWLHSSLKSPSKFLAASSRLVSPFSLWSCDNCDLVEDDVCCSCVMVGAISNLLPAFQTHWSTVKKYIECLPPFPISKALRACMQLLCIFLKHLGKFVLCSKRKAYFAAMLLLLLCMRVLSCKTLGDPPAAVRHFKEQCWVTLFCIYQIGDKRNAQCQNKSCTHSQ